MENLGVAEFTTLKLKNKKKASFKKNIIGYMFIAPNLIGFAVLTLIPVIFSLIVSLMDWNITKGFGGMKFVGLKNFITMWSDPWFLGSLAHNILYCVVTIPISLMLSLLIAIVLNDLVFGRNILRTMFFMPYISNIVAVSAVWLALYNPQSGPINQFLIHLGLTNPPKWIASTQWALPAIMIMGIWGSLGYNVVIYLAGIQNIPRDLYESANIDGANAWNRLWKVTVPMLSPSIFFLLITSLIGSFQIFGQINIMTQGGPGSSTSVIAFYIYLSGFRYYKMGYASALAWALFVIIFAITLFQWRGQKKWVNYM